MPYVRIAITTPRPEHETELRRMHEELLRFDKTLPGFLDGYLLQDSGGRGRLGRLTFWEAKANADSAAQQQHTLTVRAEMARLLGGSDSDHIELGIDAAQI